MTDVDRGLDGNRFKNLIDTGLIESSELKRLFLNHYASKIGSAGITSIWPWIVTIGSRNRKRLGGIQFCPLCLADTIYYRIHWRFCWHTCCETHKIRLHQKCPECQSAIEYHRIEAADKYMYFCASCKFDLRQSCKVSIDKAEIDRQITCDNVLSKGFGYYGSVKITSEQWFLLYKFFTRFLQKCTDSRLHGLRQIIQNLGIDLDNIHSSTTGLSLEMVDVDERVLILKQSFPFLTLGPQALKRQILDGGIRVNSFLSIMNPLPAKIRGMFKGNIPRFTKDRGACEKYLPKSKGSVLKAVQRLNRATRKYD